MKAAKQLPVIGITMGDPAGIGPEIVIKALSNNTLLDLCLPVIFGDRDILESEIKKLKAPVKLNLIASVDDISSSCEAVSVFSRLRLKPDTIKYGHPTPETGKAMASYIIEAVAMAKNGSIDAVVTAPINKKSLHEAGFDYPGHTEMLAHLTDVREVFMMLAGPKLRVVLVTIHCPVAMVPKLLDSDKIFETILITHKSLKKYFLITSPRIAVAALNPHAGEEGLFGDEERNIILPAIKKANAKGVDATGPYPSDTLFYQAVNGKFDAVVCMYHDQGLIPIKLIHFEDGVNVTLGLPIIRTSVDHGTAYDIAGKGIANPASLVSAIKLAARMAKPNL